MTAVVPMNINIRLKRSAKEQTEALIKPSNLRLKRWYRVKYIVTLWAGHHQEHEIVARLAIKAGPMMVFLDKNDREYLIPTLDMSEVREAKKP